MLWFTMIYINWNLWLTKVFLVNELLSSYAIFVYLYIAVFYICHSYINVTNDLR